MLVGGENYKILVGFNSFHATIEDFQIDFTKDKLQLIVRRNDTPIVKIDDFFVKVISGISVRNKGMEFIIESADFNLTYEFLKFVRFKTDHGWIVVELSRE
jgi:hypothetical protein